MQNKREFILVDKKSEVENVVSLYFKPIDGLGYEFISGQYVDIKPPATTGHGKSYTISSTPDDELVRLTIKRQGAVSSAIIDLTVGDKLLFDGPYGNFYPEMNMKDVVMLAGGVGVTPFYSVIKNRLESCDKSELTLLYSNKTKDSIIFFDDLKELAENNKTLKIVHCLTQEKTEIDGIAEYARIDKDIIGKYVVQGKDKCYYICGSISFVDNMWRLLKQIGVLEECIYTESFY